MHSRQRGPIAASSAAIISMRSSRTLGALPALLFVALALAVVPDTTSASTYNDLLSYLSAVGSSSKNFVAGLLAPRFDIRRALELLRNHLRYPWPAAGLPRLDPLDIREAPFQLDDPDLGRWFGSLERTRLVGLADFQCESLNLEPLELLMSFNLTWRRLDATGRYTLNGSFAHRVPARGRGPFNVTLWDVRLGGSVRLGAERPTLHVRDFTLHFDLGAATGRIQGLRGSGRGAADSPRARMLADILSETTLEMLPEMVRVARPRLAAQAAQAARGALDQRLKESRAASMTAIAWARAAAATERVLSLSRSAPAPAPGPSKAAPAPPPELPDDLTQEPTPVLVSAAGTVASGH